jgi:hypothetical protein
LIIQLLCTSGWIWSLHATAAVSPHKFHKFLIQTRYPFSNFLKFSEFGHLVFTANICVFFGAMISATTTNLILRQIGYYLPVLVLFAGCLLVHKFTSYIGRVAFHGLFLMDHEVPDVSNMPDADGSAVQAELEISNLFRHENVLSEEKALDVYHRCTAESNDGPDMPRIFDFVFPNRLSGRSKAPANDKKQQPQRKQAQQKIK